MKAAFLLCLFFAQAAQAQVFFWWSPCKKACWSDYVDCRKGTKREYAQKLLNTPNDELKIWKANRKAALGSCGGLRETCFEECSSQNH